MNCEIKRDTFESRDTAIIYRGDDPGELDKIKQAMDMKGITYYKTPYSGFVGPLSDRIILSIINPWGIFYRSYYENKGYTPEGFEIKVRRIDEHVGRRVIEGLELGHPVVPSNPSVFSRIPLILDYISLRLILACLFVGIYFCMGGSIIDLCKNCLTSFRFWIYMLPVPVILIWLAYEKIRSGKSRIVESQNEDQ